MAKERESGPIPTWGYGHKSSKSVSVHQEMAIFVSNLAAETKGFCLPCMAADCQAFSRLDRLKMLLMLSFIGSIDYETIMLML